MKGEVIMLKKDRIQAIERLILSKWKVVYKDDKSIMKKWASIELATAIEEAIGDREGLIIKKYIMTLPMGIRRKIMEHDSKAISTNKDIIKIESR